VREGRLGRCHRATGRCTQAEQDPAGATRMQAWRRPRHIRSSLECDSLKRLAPHHARLLRVSRSGAADTPLSMRVCRRSVALASHARLLARSGAAASGRSTVTSGGAASGRTGASGATQRALRPHCGAADSVPNPASLAGDDASAARYSPQRTRASKWSFKMILKDRLKSF
jgi:hypothetical protein